MYGGQTDPRPNWPTFCISTYDLLAITPRFEPHDLGSTVTCTQSLLPLHYFPLFPWNSRRIWRRYHGMQCMGGCLDEYLNCNRTEWKIMWSNWDSNPGPLAYHASTVTDWTTKPHHLGHCPFPTFTSSTNYTQSLLALHKFADIVLNKQSCSRWLLNYSPLIRVNTVCTCND